MSPIGLLILLFAAGVVLMIAEMMLPTHGAMGILGSAAIIVAIGVGFHIGQWFGVAMLIGTMVVAPFAVTAAIQIWPKTPFGRRIVMGPVDSPLHPPRVGLGQVGIAVSELRPMGWSEFGDNRHEVHAEMGTIAAGSRIKVVNISNGRLIVREV